MKFSLRGHISQVGAEFWVESLRFTGMRFECHGVSYLVGLPADVLEKLPIYSDVTLTVKTDDEVAKPKPPNTDAVDAARYRYLREHKQFHGEMGRLEWYLPRYYPSRHEPHKTLGERLDESIDGELAELAAAARRQVDLGFDHDDDNQEDDE